MEPSSSKRQKTNAGKALVVADKGGSHNINRFLPAEILVMILHLAWERPGVVDAVCRPWRALVKQGSFLKKLGAARLTAGDLEKLFFATTLHGLWARDIGHFVVCPKPIRFQGRTIETEVMTVKCRNDLFRVTFGDYADFLLLRKSLQGGIARGCAVAELEFKSTLNFLLTVNDRYVVVLGSEQDNTAIGRDYPVDEGLRGVLEGFKTNDVVHFLSLRKFKVYLLNNRQAFDKIYGIARARGIDFHYEVEGDVPVINDHKMPAYYLEEAEDLEEAEAEDLE